jgi:diguanylate cyclase (GGDEF)-like protein
MLQGLHHQLLFETTHDQLTGLINRREFERLLQEKIEDARLTAATHSLMYIDIDQFNVINTTCGYDAGDRLLLEVGERLKAMTDQEMILGRIGADEFCLLLNNCSAAEAVHLAQTQTERMRDYRFTWKEQRLPVTFGIGLVEIDGSNLNAAQVLQTAEASCRAAKQQGVNRFQIHHPDDALLHDERRAMKWIPRIDKALEEGELDLRYQSIVPIAGEDTARPHHVEILLGVTDEDGNPISPQELIMAAEHYHRMPAIDRWVIRTTFAWMAENKDKVDAMGGVAINLSGRSLSDDTFKDFILEEVQKTGASMDRVCFEVTETAGIDNLTDAAEFILDMKKSGCTFALDDFGSGLSSYAYLKNLPVDFLKIDGAFVKEMDRNPSDFAVVKSISEIGHFMGKKIIAEYVENETILGMLREIGVDYAQGYVIDKPRRLFDFTG